MNPTTRIAIVNRLKKLEEWKRCDPGKGTMATHLFEDFGNWLVLKGSGAKGAPGSAKAFGDALHFLHEVAKKKKTPGIFYGLVQKGKP